MNLPNALTVLRIFLVPVLVVVLLTRARTDEGLFLGIGIFGLAVLTDYLDGYFARRRNQVTRLGILLDPIADKLLTAAAFLSLVEMDAVPAWMVMIILGREFAVTGLRNVAAGWGQLIPASGLGKGKMVAQVVAIFLLLLARHPRFAFLHAPALARCGWWSSWPSSPGSTTSGASTARSTARRPGPSRGRSPCRPWPPRPPSSSAYGGGQRAPPQRR